jgi:hypothetical protein
LRQVGLDCAETDSFWKFVGGWAVEEFAKFAHDSEEVIVMRQIDGLDEMGVSGQMRMECIDVQERRYWRRHLGSRNTIKVLILSANMQGIKTSCTYLFAPDAPRFQRHLR